MAMLCMGGGQAMSRAYMRRRLRNIAGRLLDRAYARQAAWWHGGVAPAEEAEALRLFVALTNWERAEGTPLEGILARLPPAMAEALCHTLRCQLKASDADEIYPDVCDYLGGQERNES